MLTFEYKKVGGLSFLKIGRLSLSWSIKTATKKRARARVTKPRALQGRLVSVERDGRRVFAVV